VDRRADIGSFGVVLWDLLTGHCLFEGETVSHTLADVLPGPIDFPQTPLHLAIQAAAQQPSNLRRRLARQSETIRNEF
jgi:hypothetical protein